MFHPVGLGNLHNTLLTVTPLPWNVTEEEVKYTVFTNFAVITRRS